MKLIKVLEWLFPKTIKNDRNRILGLVRELYEVSHDVNIVIPPYRKEKPTMKAKKPAVKAAPKKKK